MLRDLQNIVAFMNCCKEQENQLRWRNVLIKECYRNVNTGRLPIGMWGEEI